MCQNLERVLPKASRGVQPVAKHESVVVVEDKRLSEFSMIIIHYDGHNSHEDHDENDGNDDHDDLRVLNHLFIQPNRHCARTVSSQSKGYM